MKKIFLIHTMILKHKKKSITIIKDEINHYKKLVKNLKNFSSKILEEKEDSKLGKTIKLIYYNKK